MLRRHFFLAFAASLVFASSVLCQPAAVSIAYLPDVGNPPLACPCMNGQPFADGAPICLIRDDDGDGLDSTDSVVGCFAMNGEAMGLGQGYVVGDSWMTLDTLRSPYYVLINSGGCCWHTIGYTLVPGVQEIIIQSADWTCEDHPCFQVLGVRDSESEMPLRAELTGIYPNPFNPETQIRFTLSSPEMVNLAIYNLTGQKVRTLVRGSYAAGEHAVTWDGRNDEGIPVGTGLYLCRMTTSRTVSTRRLLLLK